MPAAASEPGARVAGFVPLYVPGIGWNCRDRRTSCISGGFRTNDGFCVEQRCQQYSVVGTQFEKSIVDATRLRERFDLDRSKKTAFIFPHILSDSALFWGKCLFPNYEEWFVETVRAACANDRVN